MALISSRKKISQILAISMFSLLFSSAISSNPNLIQPVYAQGVVSPSSVSIELQKGQSTVVEKSITTGEILGTPDVYFLFDATNTMFGSYTELKNNIIDIQNDILAFDSNAQFGVGTYKDFFSPNEPFKHYQSITSDTNAVKTAVDNVLATFGGGGDVPESQLYALDTIANNSTIVNWREDSSRIIVWIGDSPGHDPICSSIDPVVTSDISLASTITSLQNADIRVIAISMPYPLGGGDGLNADSSNQNTDYGACVQSGSTGQATSIISATDGVEKTTNPGQIRSKILEALTEVSGDVVPDASDCTSQGLEVTYVPAFYTDINSSTQVSFDETIKIPSGATKMQYTCDVFFKTGSDDGTIGIQRIIVNGGSSTKADYPLEAPTIGRDELNSKQIVEDGFCIDDECLTVTKYWHEEFGWELNSGNHTISMKIYCVEGVDSCSHVGLSGTPIGAFNVNQALWKAEIDNNFGRHDWKLVVTDPQDYIGNVTFTNEVLDDRYLLVSFTVDFKTPTEGNLALGVHLWDYNRSLRNFWFNDGINVLDSFSYPSALMEFEDSLSTPTVCKSEEDPDARNTCTFANKVVAEILKAEEILKKMSD